MSPLLPPLLSFLAGELKRIRRPPHFHSSGTDSGHTATRRSILIASSSKPVDLFLVRGYILRYPQRAFGAAPQIGGF